MKSLEEELDEALGMKTKKEDLHPPIAPKGMGVYANDAEEWLKGVDKISMVSENSENGVSGSSINIPVSETFKDTDSKPAIDYKSMPQEYWDYVDSNDAKRNWYRIKFGKSQRGTTSQLKKQSNTIKRELDMITLMKKEKAHWYKLCMQELKEKLRGRKIE